MACKSCGKSNLQSGVKPKAPELLYSASAETVRTKRGKSAKITQALHTSFGKPRGGWRARFRVRGQDYEFTNSSPYGVFAQFRDVFSLNKVEVRDLDLWLNLNIQWYERTPDKYKMVNDTDLMSVAKPHETGSINPKVRQYHPSDWGSTAWNFMGAYLAQNAYDFRKFVLVLELVEDMLNPNINPSIGCAKCYQEFSIELRRLRSEPIFKREEARHWLVDFHNKINKQLGKPLVSFDTAAANYLWK